MLAVLAIGLVAYFQFGDSLTLANLAQREQDLRSVREQHPVLAYVVCFLLYVLVTGLSLPGAVPLTLVYGWFFGWWRAVLLVSFASTAGATVAFLLSRFFLRDWVQAKFGDRLKAFNENLKREGAFYLFTLRLIPAVPFFVINVVMGLTPMRTWTYWWVSQLGMLAGTIVFVYAGSSVPGLSELAERGVGGILSPQIFVAFALLGLFPIAVKKLATWLKTRPEA
ncbi:MAG: TVP38/TMEM64 family protein [Pirellulaceae bacterium]